MTTATMTLSAQEAAIESGQSHLHGNASQRILRHFEAIRAYGPPRASVERAKLFTESFKQSEGEPLVLRWAKALKYFADRKSTRLNSSH